MSLIDPRDELPSDKPLFPSMDTTLDKAVNQRLHDMGFYKSILQPRWKIGSIRLNEDGDMGVAEIDRLLEQVPDYAHRSCKPAAKWHGAAITVVGKNQAEAELLAQIVVKTLMESGS